MPLDIVAKTRVYTASSQLDGQPYFLTNLPSRRMGFDAERSSCQASLVDVPGFEGGEDGTIDVGWNGQRLRFFTGIIQSPTAATPSLDRTVRLVDKLGLLMQKSFDSEITWSSQSFEDAVRDVLTAVGVSDNDIAYVYDPGLTLGGEYDITISVDENPAEIFRQLMEYGGTKAIVYPNGKIYVLNTSGIPASRYSRLPSGTNMIYAHAASSAELPIIDSDWMLETIENPVIQVTITGPKRTDGVTPTGIATIDGEGRAWSAQYRFVQDTDSANDIADRELSRRAVPRRMLTFRADSNPYLYPGATIGFRDANLGISSTTRAYVWSVGIDGPSMTVTTVMGAHILDGYNPLLPPIAVPTIVSIEKEPLIISGSPVLRYLVQMTGVNSTDPDGQIMTYAWTATGATPSSSSEASPIFVYSTLDGTQQITLTVTDDTGLQNAVTITLPASTSSQVVRRQILVAEGLNGLAFLDDGETWLEYTRSSRSCTAVPSICERGSILSGWDDGAIYKVATDRSAIEAVATLSGGQINVIWVNEANANEVLAGCGNKLYRATNGTTFTQLIDFGSTVNDCQNSPANPNEIRVCTDKYLKISFDGSNFSNAITGANGTTARMLATAPWGHAAVFTGGASSSDAVKFEEGSTVDWSAVTSAPTALRTITALLDSEGFVVGDGGGKLYKLLKSGSNYVASDIVTISGTPSVDDGIRDGLLSGLHFYATSGGLKKLLGLSTIYDVRTDAALQVGYGAIGAHIPPATVEVIVPTNNLASNNGVWHFTPATATAAAAWTLKNNGLPSGQWYWQELCVNPNNQSEWLLLLNTANTPNLRRPSTTVLCDDDTTSPLWHTDDDGANWTAVTLTITGGTMTRVIAGQIVWSRTNGQGWLFVGYNNLVGQTRPGMIFKGLGDTMTSSFYDDDWFSTQWACSGINEDFIISEPDAPGGGTPGRIGRVVGANQVIDVLDSAEADLGYDVARGWGNDPQIYGCSGINANFSRFYYAVDYRSTGVGSGFTDLVSGPLRRVVPYANGKMYGSGARDPSGYRRGTILEIADVSYSYGSGISTVTNVLASPVVTNPEYLGYIDSGQVYGAAIAVRIVRPSGGDERDCFVSTDTVTWTRLPGPSSAGNSDLADMLRVIER